MKCLIIDGSSRKGNTWKLTEMVKENLKSLSLDIIFEEVHLKDLNLPFCAGCSLCFRKGHEYCPHHEITEVVMAKIEESDGVIFTAPTYNMQMPALMKNLIDHFCFLLHRPKYFDKIALVVSTTGAVGVKNATKYMAGAVIGWGFNRCYQLPIASISWNDYQPTEKQRQKCAMVTERFYADLVSKKLHSPSLSVLIPYNLFRGMSRTYGPGTRYESYDGAYWEESGLLGEPYSPKVPIPIHKRAFGNFFYWLGKSMSKKVVVTYKK